MNLWTLVSHARERYVQTFRAGVRAQRQTFPDAMVEVRATPEGLGDVPDAYRIFRVDLVWHEADQPRLGTLGVEWPPLPEPVTTTYPDGQQVRVRALKWDDCVLRVAPAVADDGPLRDWLTRWIDRDDRNPPDPDGLRAAVHSMTPPAPDPAAANPAATDRAVAATVLAVDFGTAPPEAFTALLSTLFACGATTIDVGE